VAVVGHGGAVRAYPLRILMWHEIVNARCAISPWPSTAGLTGACSAWASRACCAAATW
jgi:hypothetical protein